MLLLLLCIGLSSDQIKLKLDSSSAGVGRTGTYIALDITMDHAQQEAEVNIFNIVDGLREDRCHMVQNKVLKSNRHRTLSLVLAPSPPVPLHPPCPPSSTLSRAFHEGRLLPKLLLNRIVRKIWTDGLIGRYLSVNAQSTTDVHGCSLISGGFACDWRDQNKCSSFSVILTAYKGNAARWPVSYFCGRQFSGHLF